MECQSYFSKVWSFLPEWYFYLFTFLVFEKIIYFYWVLSLFGWMIKPVVGSFTLCQTFSSFSSFFFLTFKNCFQRSFSGTLNCLFLCCQGTEFYHFFPLSLSLFLSRVILFWILVMFLKNEHPIPLSFISISCKYLEDSVWRWNVMLWRFLREREREPLENLVDHCMIVFSLFA